MTSTHMQVSATALSVALGAFLAAAAPAAASDAAAACQARKHRAGGRLKLCLAAERAKEAVGRTSNSARCWDRFARTLARIDARAAAGGASCRFVDNGDGTVSDLNTGLMWERKDWSGGVHDVQNTYTWSTCPSWPDDCPADGTAFTEFLAQLNRCESDLGSEVTGGFAGHCDWRLPSVAELAGIVDCSNGRPCIDPAFGPAYLTREDCYWSSTDNTNGAIGGPDKAWAVSFSDIVFCGNSKLLPFYTRAVRGGF